MAKAILYDATKCTGCRGCQVACKQWNGLKAEETTNRGTYENPPDLSADTWIKMVFTEVGNNGSVEWLFTRESCMHCTDAGCVTVCPTDALYHHDMGFVAYNKDLCSGCGYCIEACPFGVPHSTGGNMSTGRKMQKCTFCQDRVTNGLEPACVKSCPSGALTYGDRAELLTTAIKRVSTLGGNAQIYGENEMDGLHVIYILGDSPEVVDPEGKAVPVNPKVSAVATAWQKYLQPAGYAVAGLVVAGLGINYLVARARMIREKEGK